MLITKILTVKWSYRTRNWFVEKGYEFTNWQDEFEVSVLDLPNRSRVKVEYLCDYCKVNKVITEWETYFQYNLNSKDACKSCIGKKRAETNIEKYGVKSPSQLDRIKKKVKDTNNIKFGKDYYTQTQDYKDRASETNLLKYGSTNPLKSPEVREKIKATLIEKYGVENYLLTKEGKEKVKNTLINKYGVENVFKLEEFQKKATTTMLKKYGVEKYAQSEMFIDKYKETCQLKYGVDFPLQNKDILEKTQNTNIERYGAPIPSQNIKVASKMKETCLNKYGSENPSQVEEFKNKRNETMFQNDSAPSSRPQRHVAKLVKDSSINYPLIGYMLDIALPNEKIYIEYDGGGHDLSIKLNQLSEEDFSTKENNRFNRLKGLGWKLIRIICKDDKLIPDNELKNVLYSCINKLSLNESECFTIVIQDKVIKEIKEEVNYG